MGDLGLEDIEDQSGSKELKKKGEYQLQMETRSHKKQ